MKVVVDTKVCQNWGQCAMTAPEVFHVGPDGLMTVLLENPDESMRAKVEDAVDGCPEQALRLED
jgi:ferredoxin